MPQVHSTAILEGDVQLADDAIIGPHCVLDGTLGPIRVGPDTRLRGHVYLNGPVTLGARNRLYPFVTIGFSPQSISYDHDHPGEGVIIGSGNILREQVTIHRAMTTDGPTTVGDDNYFMVASHVGHDCRVGHRCMFANSAMLAGHVTVGDRVVFGGGAGVQQFVRVGHHCMLSGNTGATRDLPPGFMLTSINIAGSINLVGLRRGGYTPAQIDDVRWAYKIICREGHGLRAAVAALHEREASPIVREYIEFINTAKRGIVTARANAGRGRAIDE